MMTPNGDHRERIRSVQRRLADAHDRFRSRHEQGWAGRPLATAIANFRDDILWELWETACRELAPHAELGEDGPVALVALGGTGRRDVAPFSDVDLMILRTRNASPELEKAAKRFFRDVFDVGLQLGHSIRTIDQAIALAASDPQIYTSLVDARRMGGSVALYQRFARRFDQLSRGATVRRLGEIERERLGERMRYGETVYLLEPNIKRSSGGLRDLQLIRWIGKVRYGASSFDHLVAEGLLTDTTRDQLVDAEDFLLTLRNELHFHANKAQDVLDRAQQLRISEKRGYVPATGMLPVERFMRDYFRRTSGVRHALERFVHRAKSGGPRAEWFDALFGHRTDGGFHVGPHYLVAKREARTRMEADWGVVLQMADLANLYQREIHPTTWDAVHRLLQRKPYVDDGQPLPPTAVKHFLSLLRHPSDLGRLLRELHGYGVLERLVPPLAHARGLLQFNQYHKYTVDEHCLRAVEHATDFQRSDCAIGRVYRHITQKHILHLALLLHDLGKGHVDDHRQVGERLALEIAARLGLTEDESETLGFLVLNHEMMNHLAFRRDTSDEGLVVQLAVDVRSAERLRMLLLMTACDLAAVGPGVWDRWKADVLTDLYRRTLLHLAGDSETPDVWPRVRQEMKRSLNGSDAMLERLIDRLPTSFLAAGEPREQVEQLRLLQGLPDRDVRVRILYRPATATLDVTVATTEQITGGIFHKLTGALTSKGLRILAAEIHTLEGGLVLDRFTVTDPDSKAEPPGDRLQEIEEGIRQSLLQGVAPSPYRRTWQAQQHQPSVQVAKTWVQVDNHSSQKYTILDVFATDRPGLLHCVAKTLYQLELSVCRAKVGTFLDQVVDVFYVVDRDGHKIESDVRVQQIRLRLLQEILARPNRKTDLT